MIIERFGIFRRVQVKTGRFRNGAVLFNAHSTHKGLRRQNYKGQADVFCVYCPELNKVYLINVDGLPMHVSLRVTPTKNRQQKKVLWAKNYEI